MKTREEWIKYLKNNGITLTSSIKISGRKKKVSYFYQSASEEFKNDRELNALNFLKERFVDDIPKEMIDFSFLKQVFDIKNNVQLFQLPYEWKNNTEEKEFLKRYLINLNRLKMTAGYNPHNNYDTQWTFEPNFWSNITYSKEIATLNFSKINQKMIKELNHSSDEKRIDIFVELVNQSEYNFRLINVNNRNLLPEKTVLKYVKKFGLDGITKKQNNSFVVIKEAIHNNHLNYKEIPIKWKTIDYLIELLNHKNVWNYQLGKKVIELNDLPRNFLNNKELVKSCLSEGKNYLHTSMINNKLREDKEIKKITLKTFADFRIIQDCVNDRDMVIAFLESLKNRTMHGINFFEQTKRIPVNMFKNIDIIKLFLSHKSLEQKNYICENAIKALHYYCVEDLITLINEQPETYKVLSDELKENWSLVATFYFHTKKEQELGFLNKHIPEHIFNQIHGETFEDRLKCIENHIFHEKLTANLDNKKTASKRKI